MSEIINVTRSSIPEFEEYCNEIRKSTSGSKRS